jgi:hypothetical protein
MAKASHSVRRRAFVARFTDCPEYDIKRGWSASMDYDGETKYEALFSFIANYPNIDPDSVKVGWHRHHRRWVIVHNPRGLSCFRLSAATEDQAVDEARRRCVAGEIAREGWGDVTEGRVRLVAKLDVCDRNGNSLCVFSCNGTSPEGPLTWYMDTWGHG